MTDTEQKALALLGEVSPYKCEKVDHAHHAYLCAALRLSVERHEAAEHELADVKQKVSDAVENLLGEYSHSFLREHLHQFIIPAPKPDPLINVAKMLGYYNTAAKHLAGDIRAALDAAGFEIREKSND